MNLPRAIAVWMLIMLAETAHGAVREVFIAPVLGAVRARQLGVAVGCLIIFGITCALIRWLRAPAPRQQWGVGGLWLALTLVFELTLSRVIDGDWSRVRADYDPSRGGLMAFGLAFMLIAPRLAAKLRGL